METSASSQRPEGRLRTSSLPQARPAPLQHSPFQGWSGTDEGAAASCCFHLGSRDLTEAAEGSWASAQPARATKTERPG